MSSPTLVPMIAPDGTAGSVPSDQVARAIAAGGTLGVRMMAPDGTTGMIPLERAGDAKKAGAIPRPASAQVPVPPELQGAPPQSGSINYRDTRPLSQRFLSGQMPGSFEGHP
jgi:hypothetical protein